MTETQPVIDTGAWIGRWPFAQQEVFDLEHALSLGAQAGITRSLVTSTAGILSPDPDREETLLHERLVRVVGFEHAPLIDASMPHVARCLRRAKETYNARLVKLMPSYRRHQADGEASIRAVRQAIEMGLQVALVMRVEDERNQFPLLNVTPPTPEQVLSLAKHVSPAPLLIQNAYLSELRVLASAENLMFDLAMVEGADPMAAALSAAGPERLVFASAFPFLHLPAVVRKYRGGEWPADVLQRILHDNAAKLLQ